MANQNISALLSKPLWQMTGEEFVALHVYACSVNNQNGLPSAVTRVKGVHGVAEYCNCSVSQIAKLLREGVLEPAILSRIGKSIIFDGEKAIQCANQYQEMMMEERRLERLHS